MDYPVTKVPRVEQDLRILGLCKKVMLQIPGQTKGMTVWISKQEADKLVRANQGYTVMVFDTTYCILGFSPEK